MSLEHLPERLLAQLFVGDPVRPNRGNKDADENRSVLAEGLRDIRRLGFLFVNYFSTVVPTKK
jgi:hypothetical protein